VKSPTSKLARIKAGEPPRVLDLFSGCGGLTLGVVSAGAISIGGVEFDPHAAASYGENFHRQPDGTVPEQHTRARDIHKWSPSELLADLAGKKQPRPEPDIIIGGPPCPAYTRVGRAKLREQKNGDPRAHLNDARALYYQRYLEYVAELRPLAVLMENVPDILNFGGNNIAETICNTLDSLGYRVAYSLLNAVHYGAPQFRDRLVLIALHKCLDREPVFPTPTHSHGLPFGYESSRHVALKLVKRAQAEGVPSHWTATPGRPGLAPAVTVGDAIGDLPTHVPAHRGARELYANPVAYRLVAEPGSYAGRMRTWEGFQSTQVTAHVTRALGPRDADIFRLMQPGADYPIAKGIGQKLLDKAVAAYRRSQGKDPGRAELLALKRRHLPPYADDKFPNRWRKLDKDEPSRTLMAHLGKDTYSHIHPDSDQARVITVREAARLQSFPDGFIFKGTMNPAFRQIGNSVPPLLAFAIGWEIMQSIDAEIGKVAKELRRSLG
jgi:DNA (cytosine-5)-methyltransferase 1